MESRLFIRFSVTTNSGMSHAYEIDTNGGLDKPTSRVLAYFYPTFLGIKPQILQQLH